MRRNIFRVLLLAAVISWMGLIFWFSAQEADVSTDMSYTIGYRVGEFFISDFDRWSQEEKLAFAEKIDFPIRKSAHASEYAMLAVLLAGTYAVFGVGGRRRYVSAWLITTAYAASDEFHQLFVPGRSGQISDVALDAAGALGGILFFLCVSRIWQWWGRKEA